MITTLPRYRLCQVSLQRPDLLDAHLSDLVQTANATDHERLRTQLLNQGLLRPRLNPHDLALHRWMIEIDGNVNSWGLLWKLLSGSCILRASRGAQPAHLAAKRAGVLSNGHRH